MEEAKIFIDRKESGAAGPGGITPSGIRHLPYCISAAFFNLFVLGGKILSEARTCRTALITEETENLQDINN